jgi:glycine cleavage system regulatory protein
MQQLNACLNASPPLVQLLSNVPAAVGVVVEEGPCSFHVKVNCKDRHGLLSDITHALKDLPLEVGPLQCMLQPSQQRSPAVQCT